MFTVIVNTDGLYRKFDTLAEHAADLRKPLRQFGGYLKARAKARYAAQDFAPLAEATVRARVSRGLHQLEGKLRTDVRKALKRARLARPAQPRGMIDALLGSGAVRRAAEDAVSAQTRGVRNRTAVLAVFQARHGLGGGSRLEEAAAGKPLSIKALASLGARTDRAVGKSVGRPILGGLAGTLKVTVEASTVTLGSITRTKWSEAHNAGLTVGHGAKLPQRETIKLEEADLDVFAAILEEHMLSPFTKAA